jgi:hypothetical protein
MTTVLIFSLGFLVAEMLIVGLFLLALNGRAPFYVVPRYWAENADRWESWRQAELAEHKHG